MSRADRTADRGVSVVTALAVTVVCHRLQHGCHVQIGLLTVVPHLSLTVVCLFGGMLSDTLIRRGVSTTITRKIVYTVGVYLCDDGDDDGYGGDGGDDNDDDYDDDDDSDGDGRGW